MKFQNCLIATDRSSTKSGIRFCDVRYSPNQCKRFKICQHKEGQTDCKGSDDYENEGFVSKGKQGAKCPNALIKHLSIDENHKLTGNKTVVQLKTLEKFWISFCPFY